MRSKRGKYHRQRLHNCSLGTLRRRQLVDAYHKRRHRGIERKILYIVGYLFYRLVQRLQLLFGGLSVVEQQIALSVVHQSPETFQETVYAVYALRIPRLRLLHRPEEHLVQTQRIGSVAFYNIVGIDHVVHRLRHLLHCPAAAILTVGIDDKLGVGKLGLPPTEAVCVENIVFHKIYIDVYFGSVVALFFRIRDKSIGIFYTIDEIATSLYHTLVYEFGKRFVVFYISVVE